MAGGKMNCEGCGRDISMAGAPNCDICDPDMMAIIQRRVKKKCPNLCGGCFKGHLAGHVGIKSSPPKANSSKVCSNCHSDSVSGASCRQCGQSCRVG